VLKPIYTFNVQMFIVS